jgi:signal transduction histidine kinase
MQVIRVLLVDDDSEDQKLVKQALSDISRNIRFMADDANNLQNASKCLDKNDYDVVLLDLNLTDTRGVETVKRFRKLNSEVPVVVLTGLEDEETAIAAIKAGADDYVSKGRLLKDLLPRSIRYSIERKKTEITLRQAKKDAERLQSETELANKHLQVSIERANLMTQEAMLSSQAKGEFLANMSHEIRTPMNGILGFTDILIDEPLTEQQKEYANIIKTAADNLLMLVNDILDFSKVEAGKLDTQIREFNLRPFIDDIVQLIKLDADRKGLKFTVEIADDIADVVFTDPARLRQCLFNLLSNAIKFTDQGRVVLRITRERRDNEVFLRFDVEDTGAGISKDKQELVFEAFSQVDSSSTREHGGTGLGLAITQQLARLLGGVMELKSKVGKGSTFSLFIPVNAPSQQKHQKEIGDAKIPKELAEFAEAQKYSGQALVVEDNKTNQLLITLLLEKLGIETTAANDGVEAIKKALHEPFDFIFMDMQMPNMDGYEAIKILRSEGVTIPIIAITAHAMAGDEEKCLKAGCSDYLPKPVSRTKLRQVIEKYSLSTTV